MRLTRGLSTNWKILNYLDNYRLQLINRKIKKNIAKHNMARCILRMNNAVLPFKGLNASITFILSGSFISEIKSSVCRPNALSQLIICLNFVISTLFR